MENVHAIFVHGLANKPVPAELRRIWLDALRAPVAGDDCFDLDAAGVSDTFFYWADLFYEILLPATDYESVSDEVPKSLAGGTSPVPSNDWMRAMRRHYPEADSSYLDPPVAQKLPHYERILLPGFLKKAIMAEYLWETHDYLRNVKGVRDTIRSRVVEDLNKCPWGTRRIFLGHSKGMFIAYDVMKAVADCPPTDGFMMIGILLGFDEIQDRLAWSRDNGCPSRLHDGWINVFDLFDLVSRPNLYFANDSLKEGKTVIRDAKEEDQGAWRHSATKYLKGPKPRAYLRRLCKRKGGSWDQPTI